MQIGVIGLNHKSADLSLREKLAILSLKRFGPECSYHGLLPYVLLTTCNRTEIYFSSPDLAVTHTYFLNILREGISEEFEHTIYSYFGPDCFFHLARVTSGMDSAIMGETEIQGQVKQAYEKAAQYRPLSSELHYLFQKCLKIGKEVRQTSFGPAIEETIFTLSEAKLGNLANKNILLVGISEINLRILKFFILKNLKNITLCNRTNRRAQEIATKYHLAYLPWEERELMASFDLQIYGTKAPHYLLRKENALEHLGDKKVIIDLSVPRNVDPALSALDGITLLNIDEINRGANLRKQLRAGLIYRLKSPQISFAVERQISLFRKREAFLASKAS